MHRRGVHSGVQTLHPVCTPPRVNLALRRGLATCDRKVLEPGGRRSATTQALLTPSAPQGSSLSASVSSQLIGRQARYSPGAGPRSTRASRAGPQTTATRPGLRPQRRGGDECIHTQAGVRGWAAHDVPRGFGWLCERQRAATADRSRRRQRLGGHDWRGLGPSADRRHGRAPQASWAAAGAAVAGYVLNRGCEFGPDCACAPVLASAAAWAASSCMPSSW